MKQSRPYRQESQRFYNDESEHEEEPPPVLPQASPRPCVSWGVGVAEPARRFSFGLDDKGYDLIGGTTSTTTSRNGPDGDGDGDGDGDEGTKDVDVTQPKRPRWATTRARGPSTRYEKMPDYPTHKESSHAWAIYGNRYDDVNSAKDRLIGILVIVIQVVTYSLIVMDSIETMQSDAVPVMIPWRSCRATNAAGASLIEIEEETRAPSAYPSSEPTARPTVSPSDVPSTVPSDHPSAMPSVSPTASPTLAPTSSPSREGKSCVIIPDNCRRRGRRLCCDDPVTRRRECQVFAMGNYCANEHDEMDRKPNSESAPEKTFGSTETHDGDNGNSNPGDRWNVGSSSDGGHTSNDNPPPVVAIIDQSTKITLPPLQCEAKKGNLLGWIFTSCFICFFLTIDFQDSSSAILRTFRTMLDGGSKTNFFMSILAYLEVFMAFGTSVISASSRVYVGELVGGIVSSVGLLFVHDIGGRIYLSLVEDERRRYRQFFAHYFVLYIMATVGGLMLTMFVVPGSY